MTQDEHKWHFWSMIRERRKRVLVLRQERKMSTEEIAKELKVSAASIRSDLRALVAEGHTLPDEVVGKNGTSYPTRAPREHYDPDQWGERLPGEPTHRCLWCRKWRCWQPLKKCEECWDKYRKMVEGMPEE